MKRVVVFAMLLVCTNVLAQDWAKAVAPPIDESLKVGDRIPFSELHNMISYPKKSLKFSDHKPKLVILDFWGTTCASCVAYWPQALKLQQEFGKDLQIILVNKYEREKYVKDFLLKRKRINGVDMDLPMSCRDSSIWKYFPKNAVPRYVWINHDGIVGSITEGRNVKSENIRRWITTGPFEMEQMNDEWFSVDRTKPIFVDGNGGEGRSDAFIWNSSLTKGQNNIPGGSQIFYDSINGYGITITGGNIFSFYGFAYNNRPTYFDYFDFLPFGRIELIAKDTSKYHRKGGTNENAYNYQLISGKRATRQELQTTMQADLQRYFNLDVRWEKRRKKCLVFTMFDSTLATQKSTVSDIYLSDMEVIIDSLSMTDVIKFMEIGSRYRALRYPIVDETGYKGLLTGIRAEADATNIQAFDNVLAKFGMHFKVEMREVDVLVLRERDANN